MPGADLWDRLRPESLDCYAGIPPAECRAGDTSRLRMPWNRWGCRSSSFQCARSAVLQIRGVLFPQGCLRSFPIGDVTRVDQRHYLAMFVCVHLASRLYIPPRAILVMDSTLGRPSKARILNGFTK